MDLQQALRNFTGGDLPLDAVEQRRCIKEPLGCNQGLEHICRNNMENDKVCTAPKDHQGECRSDDHTAGNFAALKSFINQTAFTEWTITGLCQKCQDTIRDEEDYNVN